MVCIKLLILLQMYSDIYYKSPAYRAMNLRAAKDASVYQYVLNYSREASRNPLSEDFSKTLLIQ